MFRLIYRILVFGLSSCLLGSIINSSSQVPFPEVLPKNPRTQEPFSGFLEVTVFKIHQRFFRKNSHTVFSKNRFRFPWRIVFVFHEEPFSVLVENRFSSQNEPFMVLIKNRFWFSRRIAFGSHEESFFWVFIKNHFRFHQEPFFVYTRNCFWFWKEPFSVLCKNNFQIYQEPFSVLTNIRLWIARSTVSVRNKLVIKFTNFKCQKKSYSGCLTGKKPFHASIGHAVWALVWTEKTSIFDPGVMYPFL